MMDLDKPHRNRYLSDELSDLVRVESLFADASEIEGEVFREVESRRTLRFNLGAKRYFVKLHFGVGWKEIVKNLIQLRLPVLGAKNEWQAVARLKALGIDTLTPVGYVSEGLNPAKIRSCIITQAIENTLSLEELVEKGPVEAKLRRYLVTKVAAIARTMHQHGINHRDFYICHFLINVPLSSAEPKLFLIDLHRAQLRAVTPIRWRVKDLAGLLFSSIDAGVTDTDLLRFMAIYSGKSARQTLTQDRDLWRAVLKRAQALYLRDHGRESSRLNLLGRTDLVELK